MRVIIAIATGALLLGACKKEAGVEAAQKEAEREAKSRGSAAPATKMATPVPGSTRVPCEQLIDVAAFQSALAEKDPLVLKDVTKTADAEAASVCSLVRSGTPLTKAQQDAKLKKEGTLGVLPGDELCRVSIYCWTIEDADRFRKKCGENKALQERNDDAALGTHSCLRIVPTGEHDIEMFRFFDTDTKCIFQVSSGPSNTDNEKTRACAKTARDTITPARIAVTPGAAEPAAPVTPPAGSGSAAGSGSGK
ncbi:MAG TPA: hypothetical protein VIU61_03365 [Kofleriaceae bacterium]